MVAMLIVDFFQRGNGTDSAQCLGGSNGQIQRFHQCFDHELLIVASFQVGHKDFIRQERLDILLLVCKGIRFQGVIHIVIDHTPNWRISGARDRSHDLDSMLTVEHIVDAVTAADFYRVDLQEVKICNGSADMLLGEIPLVLLVGDQIADWYFFKSYIRDELIKIFHDRPP